MATLWYVETEIGERGPMSFQDVAFLIHDSQIPTDGLVRREDEQHWGAAENVVGLLRAARKHRSLDERVSSADFDECDQDLAGEREELCYRERIIEAAYQDINNTPEPETTRRHFVRSIFAWAPVGLIAAAIAYAAHTKATTDPFRNKNFEDD